MPRVLFFLLGFKENILLVVILEHLAWCFLARRQNNKQQKHQTSPRRLMKCFLFVKLAADRRLFSKHLQSVQASTLDFSQDAEVFLFWQLCQDFFKEYKASKGHVFSSRTPSQLPQEGDLNLGCFVLGG